MSHLFKFARGLILALLVPVALTAVWAGWTLLSIRQDDVAFRSGELTLRGTLLSPRFGRQAPGVVLVHGSGQTSRKAMMAYAWIFASQGYAALAYDKRGVGASGGGPTEWREFSFEHLADDAAAAYRFVQSRPGVNPRPDITAGTMDSAGWVRQPARPARASEAAASFRNVRRDTASRPSGMASGYSTPSQRSNAGSAARSSRLRQKSRPAGRFRGGSSARPAGLS